MLNCKVECNLEPWIPKVAASWYLFYFRGTGHLNLVHASTITIILKCLQARKPSNFKKLQNHMNRVFFKKVCRFSTLVKHEQVRSKIDSQHAPPMDSIQSSHEIIPSLSENDFNGNLAFKNYSWRQRKNFDTQSFSPAHLKRGLFGNFDLDVQVEFKTLNPYLYHTQGTKHFLIHDKL